MMCAILDGARTNLCSSEMHCEATRVHITCRLLHMQSSSWAGCGGGR